MNALTVSELLARPTVYRRARTVSSADDIGWGKTDAGCILEVVGWLLVAMPDEWGDVDQGEVQRIAYWLLLLRDQLVEKGLYVERVHPAVRVGVPPVVCDRCGRTGDRAAARGLARPLGRASRLLLTISAWFRRTAKR